MTDSSPLSPVKPDLSGWLTAAALFWFEAWGLVGLVAIVVGPLMAFMHGSWPPSTWTDGTVLRLAGMLAVVGTSAVLAWILTGRRPRARAIIFTAIGLLGLVSTAITASLDAYVFVAVGLWLVWPSVVLVAVWGRRIMRADAGAS